MRRAWLPFTIVAIVVTGCSKGRSSSNPAAPSAPVTPAEYEIRITVETPRRNPVAFAVIRILDGIFAGQTFDVGENGRLTLTGARGNMNLDASSPGCANRRAGIGPPTSGATQSVTFTLQTGATWRRNGMGDTVFDMPRCVDRVEITGTFNGGGQNFIVYVDDDLIVNEILGTRWESTSLRGAYSVRGGEVRIEGSTGVAWTFRELGP